MAEDYPNCEVSSLELGALDAATTHWGEYFRKPYRDRFGDEHTWDTIVVRAISEIGIPMREAKQLNEVAKLETQFVH